MRCCSRASLHATGSASQRVWQSQLGAKNGLHFCFLNPGWNSSCTYGNRCERYLYRPDSNATTKQLNTRALKRIQSSWGIESGWNQNWSLMPSQNCGRDEGRLLNLWQTPPELSVSISAKVSLLCSSTSPTRSHIQRDSSPAVGFLSPQATFIVLTSTSIYKPMCCYQSLYSMTQIPF